MPWLLRLQKGKSQIFEMKIAIVLLMIVVANYMITDICLEHNQDTLKKLFEFKNLEKAQKISTLTSSQTIFMNYTKKSYFKRENIFIFQ